MMFTTPFLFHNVTLCFSLGLSFYHSYHFFNLYILGWPSMYTFFKYLIGPSLVWCYQGCWSRIWQLQVENTIFLDTDKPLKVLYLSFFGHFWWHIGPWSWCELASGLALFTYHKIDPWPSSGIANIFLLSIDYPQFWFSCDVASVYAAYRPSAKQ